MDSLLLIGLGVVLGWLLAFGLILTFALRSEGREEKEALEAGRNNKWLS